VGMQESFRGRGKEAQKYACVRVSKREERGEGGRQLEMRGGGRERGREGGRNTWLWSQAPQEGRCVGCSRDGQGGGFRH
jgi:hypothetical protein